MTDVTRRWWESARADVEQSSLPSHLAYMSQPTSTDEILDRQVRHAVIDKLDGVVPDATLDEVIADVLGAAQTRITMYRDIAESYRQDARLADPAVTSDADDVMRRQRNELRQLNEIRRRRGIRVGPVLPAS